MEYYCTGGVLQYASGHLTPIELLYVHRVREGERVAKASPSLASHHAHGRGRDAPGVYDRWARQVGGQPVIQPKAGAVEGRGVDGQHTREFNAVCTSHIKAHASPIYEILCTYAPKGKSDHSNRKIS